MVPVETQCRGQAGVPEERACCCWVPRGCPQEMSAVEMQEVETPGVHMGAQ